MVLIRSTMRNKLAALNLMTVGSEDFFRVSISNLARKLVSQFNTSDRKRKLATCQTVQLMSKFEAMVTKISDKRRLDKLFAGKLYPYMEFVLHQGGVRQ